MPGRIRSTKKLAQRINRAYFKKVFPIPLWRRVLSVAVVCIGLGWLGFRALAHDQSPYSPGPLTTSHALLAGNCAGCHAEGLAIGKQIKDATCLSCHDGPVHSATQTVTPSCVGCHVEHRGAEHLIAAESGTCTTCHSNLQTKTGKPQVATNIESFTHGHPEFAAVRAGKSDPTAIKFNHKAHVQGDLKVKCADCHRPAGIDAPWNYGQAPPTPQSIAAAMPHGRTSPRALMQPVNYYEQCSTCHALTFDDRISDAAPHDKPEVVHAFVTQKLRQYIAGHPADLGKANAPGSPEGWVKFRASEDEKQLWTVTCNRCHDLQPGGDGALPAVPETKINQRWFAKAQFDHSAHQELQCASCHPNAASSAKASDVLVPGIKLCSECHGAAGARSASADCSTCHVYHDWSKTRLDDGRFTIPQLM